MSKIGPRPLLDSLIRLDDGCYELYRIYIDIQFGQIPMTAVAVQQYRPAMNTCMVGMRLYKTLVIRESMGGWRMEYFNRYT